MLKFRFDPRITFCSQSKVLIRKSQFLKHPSLACLRKKANKSRRRSKEISFKSSASSSSPSLSTSFALLRISEKFVKFLAFSGLLCLFFNLYVTE